MSHKVRTHKWKNGILETFEHSFSSLAEAYNFLDTDEGRTSHGIKVYNESGELIHALNPEVHTNTSTGAGYN